MDWARCRKLMWHWSLLTAALIAAFWTIWTIFVGPVPVVDSIKVTPDYSWQLPFSMSRWWDVLIGPIWSVMIIGVCYVMRHSLARDTSDWKSVLVFGLVHGLIFGPVPGLVIGLTDGLAYGLVGMVFGVVFLSVVVLVFALVFMLALELIFGLVWLVKYVASRNFWVAVGNWLTAKN